MMIIMAMVKTTIATLHHRHEGVRMKRQSRLFKQAQLSSYESNDGALDQLNTRKCQATVLSHTQPSSPNWSEKDDPPR